MLQRGVKIDRGYATVTANSGENYREIADLMTIMGFPMNHSSARNHVLRIMAKFAQAFAESLDLDLSEAKIAEIARSPSFQEGICELLQQLELAKRS